MRILRLSLLILPFVALGACEEEDAPQASTQEVRGRADAVVHNAITNAFSAFEQLADATAFTSIGNALSKLDGTFSNLPSFIPSSEEEFSEAPRDMPEDSEQEDATDPAQIANEVSQWLNDNVFTDANIESQDGTSATYRLRGSAVCGETTECTYVECDWDMNPSCIPQECVSQPDTACQQQVDAIEVRIRATLVGETGLDLAILIGPARIAPFNIELRDSGVAVEADLALGKSAVEHVLSVVDDEGEVDLPSVMVGRVRAALTINAPQDVSLSYAITQAINVAAAIPEGTVAISAEARDPAASVRAQGATQTMTLLLNMGAVDVAVPYSVSSQSGEGEGSLSFHLHGLTGTASLSDGDETLNVLGLSLGDGASYIKKDTTTLVEINLNANLQRAFDLLVAPDDANDSASFSVAPGLVLSTMFNLQAVEGAWGEIESFLQDETYTFSLTGTAGGAILPLPGNGVDFDGGLKILAGTLSLASSAGASVSVEEGSCLVGNAELGPDAHPLLGWFSSANCPQ